MTAAPARLAPSVRLFLGLWPGDDVRAALLEHAHAWDWPPAARRTRPERLHTTLHFLGNVAADRLARLQEGLRDAWEGCELVLDRATVWPGGIAVLEAQRVPPALAALHARLAQRLQTMELPVETRPYRAHVTLARKAVGARPPRLAQPLRWRTGPGYLLVQSLPGGRGYEPVASFG